MFSNLVVRIACVAGVECGFTALYGELSGLDEPALRIMSLSITSLNLQHDLDCWGE